MWSTLQKCHFMNYNVIWNFRIQGYLEINSLQIRCPKVAFNKLWIFVSISWNQTNSSASIASYVMILQENYVNIFMPIFKSLVYVEKGRNLKATTRRFKIWWYYYKAFYKWKKLANAILQMFRSCNCGITLQI